MVSGDSRTFQSLSLPPYMQYDNRPPLHNRGVGPLMCSGSAEPVLGQRHVGPEGIRSSATDTRHPQSPCVVLGEGRSSPLLRRQVDVAAISCLPESTAAQILVDTAGREKLENVGDVRFPGALYDNEEESSSSSVSSVLAPERPGGTWRWNRSEGGCCVWEESTSRQSGEHRDSGVGTCPPVVDGPVPVNVGGRLFVLGPQSLAKSGLLTAVAQVKRCGPAALDALSSAQTNALFFQDDAPPFIDRNPDEFSQILEYLRTGELVTTALRGSSSSLLPFHRLDARPIKGSPAKAAQAVSLPLAALRKVFLFYGVPMPQVCRNCRSLFDALRNSRESCFYHPGVVCKGGRSSLERASLEDGQATVTVEEAVSTEPSGSEKSGWTLGSARAYYTCCGLAGGSLGCSVSEHVGVAPSRFWDIFSSKDSSFRNANRTSTRTNYSVYTTNSLPTIVAGSVGLSSVLKRGVLHQSSLADVKMTTATKVPSSVNCSTTVSTRDDGFSRVMTGTAESIQMLERGQSLSRSSGSGTVWRVDPSEARSVPIAVSFRGGATQRGLSGTKQTTQRWGPVQEEDELVGRSVAARASGSPPSKRTLRDPEEKVAGESRRPSLAFQEPGRLWRPSGGVLVRSDRCASALFPESALGEEQCGMRDSSSGGTGGQGPDATVVVREETISSNEDNVQRREGRSNSSCRSSSRRTSSTVSGFSLTLTPRAASYSGPFSPRRRTVEDLLALIAIQDCPLNCLRDFIGSRAVDADLGDSGSMDTSGDGGPSYTDPPKDATTLVTLYPDLVQTPTPGQPDIMGRSRLRGDATWTVESKHRISCCSTETQDEEHAAQLPQNNSGHRVSIDTQAAAPNPFPELTAGTDPNTVWQEQEEQQSLPRHLKEYSPRTNKTWQCQEMIGEDAKRETTEEVARPESPSHEQRVEADPQRYLLIPLARKDQSRTKPLAKGHISGRKQETISCCREVRQAQQRMSNKLASETSPVSRLRLKPTLCNPKYKTKLCPLFRTNNCPRPSTECKFAHGLGELRGTREFFKTQICSFWSAGFCRAGWRCRHAHGLEDLRPSQTETKLHHDGRNDSRSPDSKVLNSREEVGVPLSKSRLPRSRHGGPAVVVEEETLPSLCNRSVTSREFSDGLLDARAALRLKEEDLLSDLGVRAPAFRGKQQLPSAAAFGGSSTRNYAGGEVGSAVWGLSVDFPKGSHSMVDYSSPVVAKAAQRAAMPVRVDGRNPGFQEGVVPHKALSVKLALGDGFLGRPGRL